MGQGNVKRQLEPSLFDNHRWLPLHVGRLHATSITGKCGASSSTTTKGHSSPPIIMPSIVSVYLQCLLHYYSNNCAFLYFLATHSIKTCTAAIAKKKWANDGATASGNSPKIKKSKQTNIFGWVMITAREILMLGKEVLLMDKIYCGCVPNDMKGMLFCCHQWYGMKKGMFLALSQTTLPQAISLTLPNADSVSSQCMLHQCQALLDFAPGSN